MVDWLTLILFLGITATIIIGWVYYYTNNKRTDLKIEREKTKRARMQREVALEAIAEQSKILDEAVRWDRREIVQMLINRKQGE